MFLRKFLFWMRPSVVSRDRLDRPSRDPLDRGKIFKVRGQSGYDTFAIESRTTVQASARGQRQSSQRYPPSRDRSCTCAPDRAWKTSTVCRSWVRPRLAAVRSATCCAALRLLCVPVRGSRPGLTAAPWQRSLPESRPGGQLCADRLPNGNVPLPEQPVRQTARRIVKASAETDRADRS
jgi:hypothetical protein